MAKIVLSRTISNNRLLDVTCKNGYPLQYYTREAKEYIDITRKELKRQWRKEPLKCRLKISIEWHKRFVNKSNENDKRIDIDNPLKGLLNVMSGIVFEDDSQIWELKIKKINVKNDTEKVVVRIREKK